MKDTSKKGVVKMAEFVVGEDGIKRYLVSITVNGTKYTKMVKANSLLVNFLREDLDLSTRAWSSPLVWTDGKLQPLRVLRQTANLTSFRKNL
jgi:hypothetical protein